MPTRTIYCSEADEDLWTAAADRAAAERKSLSALIAAAIRAYLNEPGR
jgi:hypothetical protein